MRNILFAILAARSTTHAAKVAPYEDSSRSTGLNNSSVAHAAGSDHQPLFLRKIEPRTFNLDFQLFFGQALTRLGAVPTRDEVSS